MILPLIDIASLPGLDTLTGVFGSMLPKAQYDSSGDEIVILMVFLYELLYPDVPH